MRKYTFIISFLILSIILAFPGCGGGGGGGGKSDGNPARIKVYEVAGGAAYMPELNKTGLVFADSLSEIGNQYTVFVANNSEGVVPTIQAFCYDDNENILNIPVVFAKDTGFDDCYTIDSSRDAEGGGSSFNLIGNAPGGKGKLIASANGLTREVEVYVYDSYGVLGANSGRKINSDGSQDHSLTKTECAFYSNGSAVVSLVGKSYLADTCDGFTWKEKLRAIKTVNTTDLLAGDVDNIPTLGQIYVAEVPTGGYIKYVRIGPSMIWEYSPTTSFK